MPCFLARLRRRHAAIASVRLVRPGRKSPQPTIKVAPMQINFLDIEQTADMLADQESERLSTIEGPGTGVTTHVMHHLGRDVLLIVDSNTGESVVIEPPESFDHETGSIHDQARAMFGNAANDDEGPTNNEDDAGIAA